MEYLKKQQEQRDAEELARETAKMRFDETNNNVYNRGFQAQQPPSTESNSDGQGPPEIDPNEIEVEAEIGVGSFGKVYRGRCRQKAVAIKVLHKQNFDSRTLIAFKREVKIMSKIFHPNICLFMGACLVPGKCMIVTELLPKGDLESLLRDHKVSLSPILKMKMARDAALGMNWLHCSNPVFIHRDLKSSNLLVDENMNVKVCDFGLSQLIPRDTKIKDKQNAKGTPLWMAPEVMMFQAFNEKCDVYSYGIVLWEILTRGEPFAQYNSFDKFKEAVCVRCERPPIPADCVPSLRDLITACWSPDPTKRPAFKDIISALDQIIVDVGISDPKGRKFWKDNFLKKEEIPWDEFLGKFSVFAGLQSNADRDINIKCLQAVLAEHPKRESAAEVVNIEQFGKILDWFSLGKVAGEWEPQEEVETLFDRVRKLLMKSWFHGEISTSDAQQKLTGLPAGTFLVRFSSTHPGCYTISSIPQANAGIKHQRVLFVSGKGFNFNNVWKDSLEDIIRDSDSLYIPCPGSKFQSLFVDQPHEVIGYT